MSPNSRGDQDNKELQSFLSEVELSARKILREDNKKRREEALLCQKKAIKGKCNRLSSTSKLKRQLKRVKPNSSESRHRQQSRHTLLHNNHKSSFGSKPLKRPSLQNRDAKATNCSYSHFDQSTQKSKTLHQSLLQSPFRTLDGQSRHDRKNIASNATYSSYSEGSQYAKTETQKQHIPSSKKQKNGPTEWTVEEIREKYRCKIQRKKMFEEYLDAMEKARKMEMDYGEVTVIEQVEKHPIRKLVEEWVTHENNQSIKKSRKENNMRAKVNHMQLRLRNDLQDLNELQNKDHLNNEKLLLSIHAKSDHKEKYRADDLKTGQYEDNLMLDNVESDHNFELPVPYRAVIPEEIWLLMSSEPIKEHMLLSIHRTFNYASQTKPTSPNWVIFSYDTQTGREESMILSEEKVTSILKDSILTPKNALNDEKFVLVHEEELVLKVDYDKHLCRCSVNIKTKGLSIIAKISIYPMDSSPYSKYSNSDCSHSMIEIEIPGCEIIARLKKHLTHSAFDIPFWKSQSNGHEIWSPLLKTMGLQRRDKELRITSELDVCFCSHYFFFSLEENDEEDNRIQWNQPMMKGTESYISKVALAYKFIEEILIEYVEKFTRNISDELIGLFGRYGAIKSKATGLNIIGTANIDKYSLSIRVMEDYMIRSNMISPGCSVTGKKGLWCTSYPASDTYQHANYRNKVECADMTEPVSCFKRKSKSILVTTILAIQTPLFLPFLLSWEHGATFPQQQPYVDSMNFIKTSKANSVKLMKDSLISEVDVRLPPTTLILDPAEHDVDFKMPLAICVSDDDYDHDLKLRNPKEIYTKIECNFRKKILGHPKIYDDFISNHIYGVTIKGLTANCVKMNGQTIWCSDENCSSNNLTRQRMSGDYKCMLQNRFTGADGGKKNDTCIFTVHMSTHNLNNVYRQNYEAYQIDRKEETRKEQITMRETVLGDKINMATMILQKRKATEHSRIKLEVLQSKEFAGLQNERSPISPLHFEGKNKGINLFKINTQHNDNNSNSNASKVFSTTQDSVKFPQNHTDKFHQLREEKIRIREFDKEPTCTSPSMIKIRANQNIKEYEWRKLPKVRLKRDFLKTKKNKIENHQGQIYTEIKSPKTLGMVDPAKTIDIEMENSIFHVEMKTFFITNVLDDINRLARSKQVQQKLEKMFLNSSDSVALKEILEQQPNENTSVEHIFWQPNERERFEDDEGDKDMLSKVIIATKSSNYDVLEAAFEEGLNINSKDEHGNTLLLLACQQGNKKMAKFLLRRGATLNIQNNTGNTCLHYLYEYSHQTLAEYLIRKGADDSILNANGLTCYEGVYKDEEDT